MSRQVLGTSTATFTSQQRKASLPSQQFRLSTATAAYAGKLLNRSQKGQEKWSQLRVQDIMTKPVLSIAPEANILQAMRLLVKRGISGMPVVDSEGFVLGTVSGYDILAVETLPSQMEQGDGFFPPVDRLLVGAVKVKGGNEFSNGDGWEAISKAPRQLQQHVTTVTLAIDILTVRCIQQYGGDRQAMWQAFKDRQRVILKSQGETVGDIMQEAPVVQQDAQMDALADMLMQEKRMRLVVVDAEEKLVGIVSRGDIMRAYLSCFSEFIEESIDQELEEGK